MNNEPKKKFYKHWRFIVLAIIILAFFVFALIVNVMGYFKSRVNPLSPILELSYSTGPYDTVVIYNFSADGSVIKQRGKFSNLINLKLNGQNKPLKIKAGDSFVFSWKIDPSLSLKGCDIGGLYNQLKSMKGYVFGQNLGVETALGSREGSWEFKNVVPGVATEQGLTFYLGGNELQVLCFGQEILKERQGLYSVSVWFDK